MKRKRYEISFLQSKKSGIINLLLLKKIFSSQAKLGDILYSHRGISIKADYKSYAYRQGYNVDHIFNKSGLGLILPGFYIDNALRPRFRPYA